MPAEPLAHADPSTPNLPDNNNCRNRPLAAMRPSTISYPRAARSRFAGLRLGEADAPALSDQRGGTPETMRSIAASVRAQFSPSSGA